jgi:putative sterol carrier protein
MATALHALADRMAEHAASGHRVSLERTLSCTLPDLGVSYLGRIAGGRLVDIRPARDGAAQVKLTLSSDDLVALVDGRLKMASAWATGRVKIDAGMRDLVRLRSLF